MQRIASPTCTTLSYDKYGSGSSLVLVHGGDWEEFALTFFRDQLLVPVEDLNQLRGTELWPPIIADAKASLGDLRALSRYGFEAEHFRQLHVPVLLQIGTESPHDLDA